MGSVRWQYGHSFSSLQGGYDSHAANDERSGGEGRIDTESFGLILQTHSLVTRIALGALNRQELTPPPKGFRLLSSIFTTVCEHELLSLWESRALRPGEGEVS